MAGETDRRDARMPRFQLARSSRSYAANLAIKTTGMKG